MTTVSIIHSFTLPKIAIIDMLLWLEMKSNRLEAGGFNLVYGNKFNLQLGISLALRKQGTDALIAKVQTAEADNPHSDFLRIPIGMEGAKPAYFCLGEASNNYHGMVAGTNRSGKSTLLNNLILSACETYSPDELHLWLFDYKRGVEFRIYKSLAHVKSLHIDNKKPEYAFNAFQAFEELMDERSELFAQCEPPVTRLVDYNKVTEEPLPRCLMIIDEVQVLFRDRESRRAVQQLFDSVARQGATFGLHLLLCTQSYQNVDLEADVRAQFRLRIGLQLASSMECRALMGRDNDAPLNLPRYHAVYNNNYGEAQDNRIVALDALESFHQRLDALKQRYPQSNPAFDFASSENIEPPKTKPKDDFADWDDLM